MSGAPAGTPDSRDQASADQLRAALRYSCGDDHCISLQGIGPHADLSFDIPVAYAARIVDLVPEFPLVLDGDQRTLVFEAWRQLPDNDRLRWLRACVTDNAWQAYRVTLQQNFRVSLFSKFGTSAESASVAQKTLVDAMEQQPDARKAASDLINNSTATSVPEVRRRVNNLMTISSAGQDDTLRSILRGFGPDISSGELRDSEKIRNPAA